MKLGILGLILCVLCCCMGSAANMCPKSDTKWAKFCEGSLANLAGLVCLVATGLLIANTFM